jgi:hypothetical protein
MADNSKLPLFKNLFRGRDDVFPIHWQSAKTGKCGYSPECENKFKEGLCSFPCDQCDNQKFVPLSDLAIKKHFAGTHLIGVYPLLLNGTCFFIAADFDDHNGDGKSNPLEDAKIFIDTCDIQGIPAYIERSKSGKGFHVWVFFAGPVPAWKARIVMFALLKEAQVIGEDVDQASFDRLFPNQDDLSGKRLGNLIALPFYGKALKQGNSTFLDKDLNPIATDSAIIAFMEAIERVPESTLDKLIRDWSLTREELSTKASYVHPENLDPEEGLKILEDNCKFIQHCRDNQPDISEPLWYALASNLGRFEGGRDRFHEFSWKHHGYSRKEADAKFDHAFRSSGPITCAKILENDFKCGMNCGVESPAGLAKKGKFKRMNRGKVLPMVKPGKHDASADSLPEDKPDDEWKGIDQYSVINKLNDKHAVIMVGGKCVVLNEVFDYSTGKHDINFSSPADFKNYFANRLVSVSDGEGNLKKVPIGKHWFNHQKRRQFEGITFVPLKETPRQYNLWRGFAVEPKEGDCSLFLNHIRNNIASKCDEYYNYIVAWMANLVQTPEDKPGISIVIRGGQGTGKGIFCSGLGSLFGNHFIQIHHTKHLIGNFNAHLKDVLLVFADEAFWAGDKSGEGVLKAMVTEEYLQIEPKGKDAFRIKNYMRVLISSNNDWVVPAGLDERRFFILDAGDEHQQDTGYFRKIIDQMNNGGREALLYYLQHYDLSGIDLRKFPQTEALTETKIFSMGLIEQFWLLRLEEGKQTSSIASDWNDIKHILIDDFYKEFVNFCGKRSYIPTVISFGIGIKKLVTGLRTQQIRDCNDRPRVYIFPSLKECREEWEKKTNSKNYSWNEDCDTDDDLPF